MLTRLKTGIVILSVLTASLCGTVQAQTELETRRVALSEKLRTGDRVGRIRFLGMLELPDVAQSGLRLSQLSGLAWDDDDGVLYAISDKGGLFHLQPVFKGDTLIGLRLLKAVPLREPGSDKPRPWSRADSEGLDILNGRNGRKGDAGLVISFERLPRIVRYRPDGHAIGEYPLPAPLNNAGSYGNSNRMLESVCVEPASDVITAPETPLKNERGGHTRLFRLAGQSWFYPFAPGDRLTALECLGRDDVLVLQQNYRHAYGQIVVTLNRVRLSAAVSPAQMLKSETLVMLDSREGLLIDNFEGLAHHKGKRFFMVSDNNDLFIQRSLLLYFELLDE